MDASGSPKVDVNINDLYAFFFNIETTDFPAHNKQRKKVMKYTKLPEFDFRSNGSWPRKSYSLQPRLRRIITLEESKTNTSRSLKVLGPLIPPKTMTANTSKRKIVTISEDDEYDLHPKFSKNKDPKRSCIMSNRSTEIESKKEQKDMPQKTTSRIATSAKYLNETKPGTKKNKVFDRKEVVSKSSLKSKHSNVDPAAVNKNTKPLEKATAKKNKSALLHKTNLSKSSEIPNESEHEMSIVRSKLNDNLKSKTSKKPNERFRKTSSPPLGKKNKGSFILEMLNKHNPMPVIHVPLEENGRKSNATPNRSGKPSALIFAKPDGTTDSENIVYKEMNVGTEPLPTKVDQDTDMGGLESENMYKCVESTDVAANLIENMFDNLDIPNVSLKKDKSEREHTKEKLLDLQTTSLPNLEIPSLNITDNRNEKSFLDTHYCKSTSYIISRATLTYRTQKKINFHVVGSDNAFSNQSPSPLAYPMNVLTVFREEVSSKDISNNISLEETHESKSSKELKNCINEIKSLNCSYVPNTKKLMKPSDIISTVRVNNDLFQSVALCEQFQKELNFIDSFFESLQYLESCSLSEKCCKNTKIDDLINNPALIDPTLIKKSEYDNFLSKLEVGANSDDSETMASKNLFLLNVLIRDEQRRAKNLLSVLKRREDALKDFTKSQILYLENKKKQDNTDISALKKKQRGALLKLQHECGEMQRMRKALLALSEKRKIALMKTKKDLELKLKSNVDVHQIILGKKKLKRNAVVDRTSVPLKCFDLSSSGCEDSTSASEGATSGLETGAGPEVDACSDAGTSSDACVVPETGMGLGANAGSKAAVKLETRAGFEVTSSLLSVASVEKGIQTGDSILEPTLVNQAMETVSESFVFVDGGYLNILFHNLSLPQIFSARKQYEVNEEALKNLVDSTNSHHCENWNEEVEKLMDKVKNGTDEDFIESKSSTPSTARSLVEEFEQYYKTFGNDDRSPKDDNEDKSIKVHATSEVMVQTACDLELSESKQCAGTMTVAVTEKSARVLTVDEANSCDLLREGDVKEPEAATTGPLPVPAGSSDPTDTPDTEPPSWCSPKSSITSYTESNASSHLSCELVSSVPSLTEPAHSEAEELRRQQLAIEREIKELEQQQCRLLVVREIPDKPPPPYTPPSEPRAPKLPRPFLPDDETRLRIRDYLSDPVAKPYDPIDAFEVLVHDFCQETLERQKSEQSDKPWDACNLLPQKPPVDTETLVEAASTDLSEILTTATSSVLSVPGVSSRRSDHIDAILFTEWRHAEPEWTALHNDDAFVKNQLFETIFQRILTETVDEYKRTVLTPT